MVLVGTRISLSFVRISHSLSFGYRDKDDNYNITARAVARAVMRGPKKGLNRQ